MATGLNGFHFGFAKIMLFHELTNFFQELPLTSAIFLHFAFRHHNSTRINITHIDINISLNINPATVQSFQVHCATNTTFPARHTMIPARQSAPPFGAQQHHSNVAAPLFRRSSIIIPTKQHHHSDEAAPSFQRSSTIIPTEQHHHSGATTLKSFEAITAETHSRDVAGTPQRPWKRTSSPVKKRFAAGVRTEIAGKPFSGTARGP